MNGYILHLAAKNLNSEAEVSPRVPAFFEPSEYAGSAYCSVFSLHQDSVPDEQKVMGTNLALSSGDVSNAASDQTFISGQSEDALKSGSMLQTPAKINMDYGEDGLSPELFEAKKSRYIFKNSGYRDLRRIEPVSINLPSSGIAGRSPGPYPPRLEYSARFDSESNQRKFDLDCMQVPFAAYMHKSDMQEAKREHYRRVRWGVSHPHQQHKNSVEISGHIKERSTRARAGRYDGLVSPGTYVPKSKFSQLEMQENGQGTISFERDGNRSQNQPQQKNHNKQEDPGYADIREKRHISLANAVDLSAAQYSSKGIILDQSLPSSDLRPEIADLEIGGEKTSRLRETLFGMAKGKDATGGSVFKGRFNGSHFMLRKANGIDQKKSRSIEKTISADAVIHLNTANEPYAADTSERTILDQSQPFSELSPGIADLVMDRNKGSYLVRAVSIGSMPGGRSRGEQFKVRKAVDTHQEAPRSSEKAVSTLSDLNGKSIIQVTIGRIEVRAEKPHHAPSVPPICRPAPVSRLSLDEYLKKRSTGQL